MFPDFPDLVDVSRYNKMKKYGAPGLGNQEIMTCLVFVQYDGIVILFVWREAEEINY